jgi:hypothetical protein
MTLKLLHIADDEKFIDGALELFEAAAPGSNSLIVHLPAERSAPVRIKRTERVMAVRHQPEAVRRLLAELPQYAGVIIHGLSRFTMELMLRAPLGTRFLWLAWGYDVYRLPEHRKGLYQPATQQIVRALRDTSALVELMAAVKSELHHLALPLMQLALRANPGALANWPMSSNLKAVLSCARRMSGCATVVPDEWPLVERLGFRGEFFRYNYAWIEQLFPDGPVTAAGPNILVGNSSSASCNHVDTFQALSGLDLRGRKIVVPLSYGSAPYREHVVRQGSALLGAAFTPILDFLPLARYNELLQSCGTVIMNHHRQQAVGNIMTALYMGARVFLNEVNPCHSFFTRIGARVFSLGRDARRIADGADRLSEASIEASRAALRAEYSKAVSLERARALVGFLSSGQISGQQPSSGVIR